MSDGFEIDFDFIEKWGRFAKPEYFRIYLYILGKYKKDKTTYTTKELAEILDIKEIKVKGAFEYWAMEGFLTLTADSYIFTRENSANSSLSEANIRVASSSRPSYNHSEIDRAASKDKNISYLFNQAEKILGKLLSSHDMEILYSFVDWLNLPVEVIIMILNYASARDKKSMRYIEKMAVDWADREINTYEKAEDYIKKLEESASKARKICNILGIHDRALSTTEKKYIKLWSDERDIPFDLIPVAYDKTMMKTGGKMGWAYMNKLLCSWQDAGIKTQEELETANEQYRLNNAAAMEKPSQKPANKFNNYNDTNEIDYEEYAKQVLSDMLDE